MRVSGGAFMAAALFAAVPAKAQIDDARRFLIEGGFEQNMNPGPNGVYAFAYLNRPGVAGPGSAFRLALAPVYADMELGLKGPDWSHSDVGLGFSGGGFAFGQSQVNRGDEKRGESFLGHGGGPSLSLYPRLGALGPVPLNGVVRVSAVYTDYQRTSLTDPGFEPPPDEWTGAVRAGLRLGGQEPGLSRSPAMEVSTWWEYRRRDRPASYGYNNDRAVKREVNLYWARALIFLPAPRGVNIGGALSVGGGDRIGRLSAYRLGGMLTQNSEFPLIIPGYFSQQISASKFGHVWLRAGIPIDAARRFIVNLTAAGAAETPVQGTDAGGVLHAGLSAGLEFTPPKGALHGELAYGYAPTALRGERRGAHSVALTLELDFEMPDRSQKGVKTRQQGLSWLLGL